MAIGDLIRNLVGFNPSDPTSMITPASAPAPGGTGPAAPGAPMVIGAPAGVPAGGAPAAQDGAPAPAPAAPAAAPATPPDLTTLYTRLMDKERSRQSIDSGLTLMAAGLASPENRAALIGMAGQQSSANMGQAANTLKTIMALQNNQTDLIRKEALRRQLPTIAKQTGVPLEQVQQMFEAGKMDDLLKTINSPDAVMMVTDPKTGKTIATSKRTGLPVNTIDTGLAPNMHVIKDDSTGASTAMDLNDPTKPAVPLGGGLAPHYVENPNGATGGKVVQDVTKPNQPPVTLDGGLKPDNRLLENKQDGSTVVVDGNTGTVGGIVETGRASNYQPVTDDATGKKFLVDYNNPTAPHIELGTGKNMDTNDTKNYSAYVNDPARPKDKPLKDFDTWLGEQNKQKATQTLTDKGDAAIVQAFAPTYQKDFDSVRDLNETSNKIRTARSMIEDPNNPIIAGSKLSPYTLEGRKIIAGAFGLNDAATTNTDTLMNVMKEVVLPKVKALGTGNSISDADRSFIEKAVGGSIELTPDTIRRTLRIMDVATRVEAIGKNKGLQDLHDQSAPETQKYIRTGQVPDYDHSAIGPGTHFNVPENAAKYLTEHPEARADFDKKYGHGMKLSTYVLGHQ